MPLLQTPTGPIKLSRRLLPLRPTHPRRLRTTHDTNHLLGNRQVGINRRRKRMDQLGPVMIPQPKHSTTIRAEVAFRRASFFAWGSTIFNRSVFSSRHQYTCILPSICKGRKGREGGRTWLGLCHAWSQDYLLYHLDSRCRRIRPLCDRYCMRRTGRGPGFGSRGWIRRRRIGSFLRDAFIVLVLVFFVVPVSWYGVVWCGGR